jgi:hypothetical protein
MSLDPQIAARGPFLAMNIYNYQKVAVIKPEL